MKRPTCAWCGRRAIPVDPAGVYLALLYPGRSLCSGCGRLTLHCACRP